LGQFPCGILFYFSPFVVEILIWLKKISDEEAL
jgi:hypothetical protein